MSLAAEKIDGAIAPEHDDVGESASTSPEMDLIVAVLSEKAWPRVLAEVRAIVGSGIDWRRFLHISMHHGVVDLVFDKLRPYASELMPESLIQSLVANSQTSAHRNLYFSSELIHIIGKLESGGIDVVSLKGPLLGAYLYDNISLRPFGDLDLVVKKEDILKAKMLLVEEGFYPVRLMSSTEEDAYIESQFALTLTRRRGDLLTVAELHWALTHRFFSFRFGPEEMWTRTTEHDFSGTPIRTLSNPLLLLFLCVHGAKHHWSRLIWLCDVVRLAELLHKEDWQILIDLARRTRSMRIVCVALDLGNRLLGYEVPSPIAGMIESDKKGRDWTVKLATYYRTGTTEKLPKILGMRFQTGVRENVQDRWGSYLQQARLLLQPTESDREVLPLPAYLSPLYYAVRPIRVLYQKMTR